MAMNPMNGKFEKDTLKMVRITNENLVPANTSKCEKYDLKPDKVLDGGKCEEFDAE